MLVELDCISLRIAGNTVLAGLPSAVAGVDSPARLEIEMTIIGAASRALEVNGALNVAPDPDAVGVVATAWTTPASSTTRRSVRHPDVPVRVPERRSPRAICASATLSLGPASASG